MMPDIFLILNYFHDLMDGDLTLVLGSEFVPDEIYKIFARVEPYLPHLREKGT